MFYILALGNTLFEEVGLSCKRNVLHEVKWIGDIVVLLATQGKQQSISNKLDVLTHQSTVHSEQVDWQSIGEVSLFDVNSLGDDLENNVIVRGVVQVREKQTCKVGVQSFVSADQLVGEGQTWHQTSLLKPEDRSERTREENTLNGSKCNKSFSKQSLLIVDPSHGPLGLFFDTWDGLDSVEKELGFLRVFDVGINQKRVGLGVDVLHHDLESVETLGLWDLDLGREVLNKVLVNDTI
ncbi:hypothetical protein OGAPHI_007218 [Ogataea philodendri]|uniref:Uncharacterized protein n=1 Tax=Ogataea philodendri TaxID=1378263 RepID=A0A9P8NUB5_9ASCO|nr:uncharacterized protein OGAPHI_007218 [Ogataea philodendri]KAH3660013.1 hypothetical protein OGAPHI_007218 [Ogataea philodendri]